MRIQTIPNINFKSDYYGFRKPGTKFWLNSIKTDDLPTENKDLLLRIKDYRGDIHGDFPMTYDGKYYTWNMKTYIIPTSYEILNKKEEAGEKELSEFDISRKINVYDRITTGKTAEKIVSKGSTEGLLVTDINKIPKDKPVVLMIDKIENDKSAYEILPVLDTNILGIIINNAHINTLTHDSSIAMQYFDVVSIVYDDKKYNELKKLAGKYITISNESGEIKFSKTEELPDFKALIPKVPNIPILDEEEKLLDFSELTRKNSGEKAYRLGVMQRLLKEGYLSDIEIPAGFVIPVGYINKIYEYINATEDEIEQEERIINHPLNSELAKVCQFYGLEESDIIIRSAFNAEDLSDYPTAGIYDSYICYKYGEFIDRINDVVTSKDSITAQKSRERYGLQDSIIQPSIIVQKLIRADYTFTLYTDTNEGKLIIEIDNRFKTLRGDDPTIVSYDKNTDKIKLETLPHSKGNYLIKDTDEVIEQHFEQDKIEKDWKSLVEPLKIAVKNALKLEKYFGRPQDIEGGIRNGKVYFWQTRDIVKKAIKH